MQYFEIKFGPLGSISPASRPVRRFFLADLRERILSLRSPNSKCKEREPPKTRKRSVAHRKEQKQRWKLEMKCTSKLYDLDDIFVIVIVVYEWGFNCHVPAS